jgi:hypothetical protein
VDWADFSVVAAGDLVPTNHQSNVRAGGLRSAGTRPQRVLSGGGGGGAGLQWRCKLKWHAEERRRKGPNTTKTEASISSDGKVSGDKAKSTNE